MIKHILYSLVLLTAVMPSVELMGLNNFSMRGFTCDGSLHVGGQLTLSTEKFTGKGSVSGTTTSISCISYTFNGSVVGTQECFIQAKTFTSRGTIKSPKVTIICDEFNHTGSILAQECVIYATKPFDYSMFTRDPQGKYTIVIARYGFQPCTREILCSLATSRFVENYMSIQDQRITDEVNRIKSYARLNGINFEAVIKPVHKKTKQHLQYLKGMLHKKYGSLPELTAVILKSVLGTVGVCATYPCYSYVSKHFRQNKADDLPEIVACGLLGISFIIYRSSYFQLREWCNPQHKEKYHKLSLLIHALEEALHTPDESIQEIIVLSGDVIEKLSYM